MPGPRNQFYATTNPCGEGESARLTSNDLPTLESTSSRTRATQRVAETLLIRALDYLHRKHPRSARVTKELAYFRNNRHRMRYREFKAEGLPIGSGVVEAACKTLVTQRLKQSGMRWEEQGGQAILTVRGWTQSGDRFERAWALLAATYQAEVVTLHNVVPFPAGGRRKGR
jgi:hypothetical protein